MRASSPTCFFAALAVILTGLAVLPRAVAQADFRKTPGEGTAFPRTAPTLGDGTVIEAKRLSSVLGIDVRTDAERNVGRIIDLLANRDGQVEAAVIEFGGFLGMGTRKIAIDWSALHLETNDKKTVAVLDMNRDQLRAAPEYKPDEPVVVRKIVPQAPISEMTPPETTTPIPFAKQEPPTRRKRRHHTRNRD